MNIGIVAINSNKPFIYKPLCPSPKYWGGKPSDGSLFSRGLCVVQKGNNPLLSDIWNRRNSIESSSEAEFHQSQRFFCVKILKNFEN